MVVASGGLNQQRNQIVDAVVIARILEAAPVFPIFPFCGLISFRAVIGTNKI